MVHWDTAGMFGRYTGKLFSFLCLTVFSLAFLLAIIEGRVGAVIIFGIGNQELVPALYVD